MKFYALIVLFIVSFTAQAQINKKHLVYVDKGGVMRYTADNKEASFFGVNYTVPFAHGYRMHKRLGVDHKRAIDADVYHMHRLGLTGFRVHVWDTEITDSAGNLLKNEHLDLYDYLVWKLQSYGIKTFLTPLAYWGNGYPEPDEKTGSFASIINNKQKVLTEEWAIQAQEKYLKQLLQHVNPYTGKKYGDDRNVIALEINNEPHHSGPKEKVKEYISRMVKAVRSTGWTKPIFYNISESPAYADVVANSDIEGVSFQWYPTGLVANRTLKGNYLPNVDHYRIPFRDTIQAFKNKALMVYEFDAADVADSYMYPAMARSFRTAGFQWATQFAYDPLHTAHFNTEYQTHYLNLLYTPSKAISLMIAAKVFQKLPRLKSYGNYPQDTLFDVFRLSYRENLSEMNEDTAFYYSNSTNTVPKDQSKLKHIAGVGSSSIVQSESNGAYFLDKVSDGVWRLEVYPHVISQQDPFEKASPSRAISYLDSSTKKISVSLKNLGKEFTISYLSKKSDMVVALGLPGAKDIRIFDETMNGDFSVSAGVYTLSRGSRSNAPPSPKDLSPFYFPIIPQKYTNVLHSPASEVTQHNPLEITAIIDAWDTTYWINLEVRNSMNQWKTISGKVVNSKFEATIPAEMMVPGIINYRMILRKRSGDVYVFPGGHKGDPYAWDNQYINESWSTYVTPEGSPLRVFDPVRDREKLMVYNPDWRNNLVGYSVALTRKHLVQWLKMSKQAQEKVLGWQLYVGDMIKARSTELDSFTKIALRGKSLTGNTTIRIALIDEYGSSFETVVLFDDKTQDVSIPLSSFKSSESMLLPAAYPRFMPRTFKSASVLPYQIKNLDKIEVRVMNTTPETDQGVELEFIQLTK